MAFGGVTDVGDIMQCIQDVEVLQKEMYDVIIDFEQSSFEGYIHGMQEVMLIVHQLPQDIKDCESIGSALPSIEKWADIFSKPITLTEYLVRNLIENYEDIHNDI